MCSLSDIPKFGELINNVTASVGREATLACVVDDLATYKVGWFLSVFFFTNYWITLICRHKMMLNTKSAIKILKYKSIISFLEKNNEQL